MRLFKPGRHDGQAASAPKETVTMIDRELRSLISRLNKVPPSGSQREAILSQISEWKLRRREALQPKTYGRMLASLE